MRKLTPVLVVMAMLVMTSLALAREAPPGKSDQVAVAEYVAPVVANVPPVGFDVIQNISTANFTVKEQTATDTSVTKEQGTTGDERSFNANYSGPTQARWQPDIVLLA